MLQLSSAETDNEQQHHLLIFLAVFQDARELDVVKVASLDRGLLIHLVNLSTQTQIYLLCH